jgi:hypothetical protein
MRFKPNEIPPVEILRRYFRVDEHSRIQRRTSAHGWILASRIMKGKKYFSVGFEGKRYPAHRIIWTLHYGRQPTGLIDHINGKPWDNRIENLREATHAQNSWNVKPKSANKTGYRNVHKTVRGYEARVMANYKLYRSPVFDDPELVGLIAETMRIKLHGEFDWSARP